MLSVYSNNKIP